jgi:opacity protein-like surface antigen
MKPVYYFMVVLIAHASINHAQEYSRPSFYVNTGMAVPSAPDEFSDYWNMGFNVGGGIGLEISPNVQFVPTLSYSNFSFDGNNFLQENGFGGYGFDVSGGNAKIITLNADFKFQLSPQQSPTIPYIIGDAGLFRLAIDDMTLSYQGQYETVQGDSENKFGLNLGAGLDFSLNPKIAMSLGAKYVIGLTEDESTRYFPLQIGFAFR